jgi:hypothetical protein
MSSDDLKKDIKGIRNPLSELVLGIARPVIPEMPKFELPVNQNLASEFHKRLVDWINNFDNNLDNEFEVGVRLVNFGQSVTFHLQDIGYWNPSLISFSGHTEQGDPVELIQHVSQISILLLKVKRKDPSQPKRPIGFGSRDDQESN